jgi:transcriptional regulator with XRE-family HTH domain
MKLDTQIEKKRKFLNLTQTDLAELCGISTKSIQKIENNQANPTIETLEKILDVLGMELTIQNKPTNHESNSIL